MRALGVHEVRRRARRFFFSPGEHPRHSAVVLTKLHHLSVRLSGWGDDALPKHPFIVVENLHQGDV